MDPSKHLLSEIVKSAGSQQNPLTTGLPDFLELTKLQGRGDPMIGFQFDAVEPPVNACQDVRYPGRGVLGAHEFDMPGTDVG